MIRNYLSEHKHKGADIYGRTGNQIVFRGWICKRPTKVDQSAAKYYDKNNLFGETGENPVRARRRETREDDSDVSVQPHEKMRDV